MRLIASLLLLLVLVPACSRPGVRFATLTERFDAEQEDVLYAVETELSAVALTIDDGPDAEWTPRILDLLEEYDAHATFFLIGENVKGYEPLVEAMVSRGHELGNHMIRDEVSIELSPQEFEAQLTEVDELLSQWAKPHYVRPGSGWYDESMIEIANRHGYTLALGSVYPLDAQIAWSRFASWFVLQAVGPGSVIVLHSGGARGERTHTTLQKVLPELRTRGLRVLSLSELVAEADANKQAP